MKSILPILALALLVLNSLQAQSQVKLVPKISTPIPTPPPPTTTETEDRKEKMTIDGQVVTAMISGNDTFIVADLEDVTVSSLRSFEDKDEYRRYLRYRRYAAIVYPYANDAIKLFREVDYVTQNMSKRKRRKHIRKLGRRMKKEFKKPLKKLTKTQGRILIEMIEKELDTPFYDLIKNLRGGLAAMYWNQLGKFNGYRLKEGYIEGDDPILDAVLKDFNISHEILEEKQVEE